ncbi:MAG TPA: methyl-accepting chemotaxis protein [Acidimicrobiales bacterium]|nr:methyl-accepting chemotaxis protein [Acidimicrobiales bacterium]
MSVTVTPSSETVATTQDRPAGRATKALFVVLGLILAGYLASLVIRSAGSSNTLVDGWGVSTFEMVASLLVVWRGLTNQRDRAFGLWLGIGMAFWAAGDFAMTFETLNGASPSDLSFANWLWFGFFPLSYIGCMVLMRRDVRRFTTANYLDAVIGCLVTGALFTAFAFSAIESADGSGTAFTVVNVIYPIGDLLLLFVVGIPIKLLPPGTRSRWYLIALACISNAAGDISALFPNIQSTHIGYVLNCDAWPMSLYLIAAAIWLAPSRTDAPQQDNSNGFSIPTIAGSLALLVLFVVSFSGSSQAAVVFASATLLAAGIRFGIALRRMRSLTEERHRELEDGQAQLAAAAEAEQESSRALQRTVDELDVRQKELADAAIAEQESKEALQRTVEELDVRQRELADAAELAQASKEALNATARRYSEFASKVADGDLTATLDVEDGELSELAVSLNRMVESLADISRGMKSGVVDMGSSTADILAAVRDHTESAARQSSSIEQVSITVDALGESAGLISDKADEVARRARESLLVSNEGTRAVQEIAQVMDDIQSRVDGIAGDITTLSERTRQIADITATVNGLAEASNLLSLNATIEAARAGEHGRAFGVVAEEVRNLAEQSRAATGQVEAILADIQVATAAAVRASEQGRAVVSQGLELTSKAGEGIESLSETIKAASASAEDIAASVQQQSAGMTQISGAIKEINVGTGHFVDGARQSQSAAENLNDLSGRLAALAERYRT